MFRRRFEKPAAVLAVTFYMAVAELGVRLVKLPRLTGWLGIAIGTSAEEPSVTSADASALRYRDLALLRAVSAVAPKWPFADGPCLRQALVAGWILRRRRPTLRLGVARGNDQVLAHAWIEVDGVGTLGWQQGYLPLRGDTSTPA